MRSSALACGLLLLWGVVGAGCRHAPPTLVNPPYPATIEQDLTPGTPAVWREVVAQADSEGGRRVLHLDHGADALDWRLNLIRSAQSTIDLQTFIWTNDEVGRLMVWELLKAVRQRGVRVRLLVDQMFSAQNVDVVAFLATFDPRLEIEFFHPNDDRLQPSFWETIGALATDFRRVNRRMHNKTLVVDRQIAIVGGRNYENTYFDANLGLNFKDRDLLVVGTAAKAVAESMDDYWSAPNSVPAAELVDVAARIERGGIPNLVTGDGYFLYGLFEGHSARASDPKWVRQQLEARLLSAESIVFVADPPFKKSTEKFESMINHALVDLVQNARRSVLIQTPYLVLSDDAIELFRQLRSGNPQLEVSVSTNSLAATDSWPTYAASYSQKATFVRDLRFHIAEFRPIPQDIHLMMDYVRLLERLPTPAEAERDHGDGFKLDPRLEPCRVPCEENGFRTLLGRKNPFVDRSPFLCLHQKTLVIDDQYAFVGSYNLDPRSEDLNTECGFVISGSPLVEEIRNSIERDLRPRNAYLVGPAPAPLGTGTVRGWFEGLSASAPVDLWPWRSNTSYCLRDRNAEDQAPINFGHPDFSDHWEDVGPFPLLGTLNRKQVRARLFKGFGMALRPLL